MKLLKRLYMMNSLKKLMLFNAIDDTNNLVKKADYKIKVAEIEKKILDHDHNNKYIATQEFNKLTAETFTARLKQANLATKTDIDDLLEKTDFDNKLKKLNKKVTTNKTKHTEAEKKTKKFGKTSENGYDYFWQNVFYR